MELKSRIQATRWSLGAQWQLTTWLFPLTQETCADPHTPLIPLDLTLTPQTSP